MYDGQVVGETFLAERLGRRARPSSPNTVSPYSDRYLPRLWTPLAFRAAQALSLLPWHWSKAPARARSPEKTPKRPVMAP